MNPLMNLYIQQTERYMRTPDGTAFIKGILSVPTGSIPAAIAGCARQATGIEDGSVIEDIVVEYVRQETASRRGYLAIRA